MCRQTLLTVQELLERELISVTNIAARAHPRGPTAARLRWERCNLIHLIAEIKEILSFATVDFVSPWARVGEYADVPHGTDPRILQ